MWAFTVTKKGSVSPKIQNGSHHHDEHGCSGRSYNHATPVVPIGAGTGTTLTITFYRKILLVKVIACTLFTFLRAVMFLKYEPSLHDEFYRSKLSIASSPFPSMTPPSIQERVCTSPEKEVPWIFGTKSCSSNRQNAKLIQSRTSENRCGYCKNDFTSYDIDNDSSSYLSRTKEGEFVQYLHDLSEQLRTLKEKECSSLIVYGVAFGEEYLDWLTRQKADESQMTRRQRRQKIPFKMSAEQVDQLLQLHGPCFMTFVLAEHLTTDKATGANSSDTEQKHYYSNDGLQLLIPIERRHLPYVSMRRNTKIFKMMGPSYLFGNWVKRVVWQDAKLIAYNVPNTILPHNYYDYFFNVIHMTSVPRNSDDGKHVCASFMGLPYHENTMGTSFNHQGPTEKQTVRFSHHCDTIVEASTNRPTVSDDLHSVQHQCSSYLNQTKQQLTRSNASLDEPPQQQQYHPNALDDALIDSAFIIWDFRSERCQNFVAALTCTWMDEIHCYSDRDQISFPHVFLQMGLQVIPTDILMNYHNTIPTNISELEKLQQLQNIATPETHHRLFAFSSTPLQPIVHITKSSCHWYYNNLNDCDFIQNDPAMPMTQNTKESQPIAKLSTSPNVYKLAIIVTGSFHRFIFESSLQRFLQPLSSQGHYVDYYLSLSMNKAPAYRSNQNYMNRLVTDPFFHRHIYQEDNVTVIDEALLKTRILKCVQEALRSAGANLRYVTFQDNYAGMGTNEKVIDHRRRAQAMYPHEDPDLRFPIFDIRDVTIMNRTANANRNMLNLFYHIQHVYQQVLAYEMDNRVKYDYVLFLRDDTMWLQNLDFRSMVNGNNVATTTKNRSTRTNPASNVELFVPLCDARVPSMHPTEINDHIAIVKRDKADLFGNYFDELFSTDMESCAKRLDDELRYGQSIPQLNGNSSLLPSRGCNSEMILHFILANKKIHIQKVGQGKIPFQRMAFVKDPVSSAVQSCFHKYCQSHTDPLIIPPGIVKCTELK